MNGLSIKKLISLADKKGYYCSKFFCYKKTCVYIEVLDKETAHPYMLYIPSNYDFICDHIHKKYEYYDISYLDYTSTDDIVDKYGKNLLLDREYYGDIDLVTKYNEVENMENKLNKKYENNIILNKYKSGEHFDLRCIVRQLERLKNCVAKLDYKLCIFYKKYLCTVRRDNSIECYYVKQLNSNYRNVMVTFDLEMLYNTTPDDIKLDLVRIKEGVYDIFDTNRDKHLKQIFSIFDRRGHIQSIYNKLLQKKSICAGQILNYQQLFITLKEKEEIISEKINKHKNIREKYANQEATLIRSDKIKVEAMRILELQNKVIVNMNISRQKYNDVLLTIDKILFDNIVMLDKVMKNFNIIDIMLDENVS